MASQILTLFTGFDSGWRNPARWSLLLAGSIASLAILHGCGGNGNTAGLVGVDMPRVRAVNAFPGVAQMKGQVGPDSLLTGGAMISYGTVAPYIITQNNSETVSAYTAASELVASRQSVLFRVNKHYSVIGYGQAGDRRFAIFEDDNGYAGSGASAFRFINVLSSIGAVDIYITNVGAALPSSPTVAALGVGSASTSPAYTSWPVPVGGSTNVEVRVTQAGARTVLFDLNPLILSDNERRSVILTDPSPSTGQPGLGYVDVKDSP